MTIGMPLRITSSTMVPDAFIALSTCSLVFSGNACFNKVKAPATIGVAALVPELVRYPSVSAERVKSGARSSIFSDIVTYQEISPEEFTDPTATTSWRQLGKTEVAMSSTGVLPAAAKVMIPRSLISPIKVASSASAGLLSQSNQLLGISENKPPKDSETATVLLAAARSEM